MSLSRSLLITAAAACLVSSILYAQTASSPQPPAPPVTPAATAPAAAPAATPPATPAAAAPAAPTAPSMATAINPDAPVTRGELPALIKEAIMKDPQMLIDAVKKLHEQQVQKTEEEGRQALAQHKDDLYKDTQSPAAGNLKDPDVVLVEFFDYHCGYCKHLMPSIQQLLKEDKKVKIIFREFPILSEDSVLAARAALAVNKVAPDKYFDYHVALMKSNGKFDEKTLLDIAKKEGINPEKVKAELPKDYITEMLDKNRALADTLGIRGTPALAVDDQLLPGALPYEDLKKVIELARSGAAPSVPVGESTPVPPPAKQ